MTPASEDETSARTEIARLRRVLTLRAMMIDGESQREFAARLGVTQPSISYQVATERTSGVRPRLLVEAGGSVLPHIAESHGFTELAVFGSAARGDDRPDSDLDLLVRPAPASDMVDMLRLEDALAGIVGRSVDP